MQQEQAHRQFDETAAKFIMRKVNELSGGYEFLEFQDADGVTPGIYVSETYINLFPTGLRGIEAGNLFEWNPACDTEDDTDPRSSPLLPIPFTANELAAFLLYGVGDYIQEKLGPIGRLDEDELEGLGGVRDKLPRQALRAAYAEAERAQQVVGPPDIEAQKLADTLSDQLDEAEHEANRRFGVFARDISADEANRRRDMAIESVAELRRRTETAREKAAKGLHEWRKAMVRYLLPPVSPAPEQPVRADSEPAQEEAQHRDTGIATISLAARPAQKRLRDFVREAVDQVAVFCDQNEIAFDRKSMPGDAGDLLWLLGELHPERFKDMKAKPFQAHYKDVCSWPRDAGHREGARWLYLRAFPELRRQVAGATHIRK